MKDVDKDEKDGLAPDVVKTWKDQVYEVVKEALEFLDHFSGENPTSKPEDSLAPLRKAIETATHLAEAVAKEIQDPSEERLRDLARKLGAAKKEIMALSRCLMVGQAASIATEAKGLAGDAGEDIKSSRETIKAALRGLGAASDISEVSGPTRVLRPPPNETRARRLERGVGDRESASSIGMATLLHASYDHLASSGVCAET